MKINYKKQIQKGDKAMENQELCVPMRSRE